MIALFLLALAADSGSVQRRVPLAPHETLTVTILASTDSSADVSHVPVVLLPGLLGASFGYRKVTPAIAAAGHPTYIVDELGVGTSTHPDHDDYSLDAQTDRVAAALDSLGVGRAVLVGSNFGASVALRLAYRRPEHVSAVLLLDGGPIDRPYTGGVSSAMKLGPLLNLLGGRGIAKRRIHDALIGASADSAWVTRDVVEAYARPIVADLGAALGVMKAMRDARASEPLRDNLARITQPVRLLVGAANRSRGIESDEVALLCGRLPDFHTDSVARSGAYLHEERPDAVIAAVLALGDSAAAPASAAASCSTNYAVPLNKEAP